jgi:hypothetical protein
VKIVLGILAGIVVTAAVAALVLRQATGQPHLRDVAYAAAITLVSAELALIPVALVRKSSPVALFQAAFGGTVLHLFLTLALGAAVHGLNLVDRRIFLFLLLGLYWFSLIFVVSALIRVFRRAMPGPNGSSPSSSSPPPATATH